MELGNQKQAAAYYRILQNIDRTNAVVTGFRAITAINDTLRRARDNRESSRLLLERAQAYWSIGLFDEAFDSVNQSIGADRSNVASYQYLAELFEKTEKPWGVRRARMMLAQAHG
jgi:Tfp pilus assembly protein PilF